MLNAFEARDGCLAPVARDELPERMGRVVILAWWIVLALELARLWLHPAAA